MKTQMITTFALFSLAHFGWVTSASAEALSFDQALKEAQTGSLELQISNAETDSSDWAAVEARANFLPKISLDASHYFNIKYQTLDIDLFGRQATFPFVTPATTYSLMGTWNIFNGFQDAALLKAAKLRQEAAHQDYDWSHFQVEQNVKLSFYETIAARLLESAAQENVSNLETHLNQIESMMKAGEAIQVDVLRVQVQLSSAKSQLINAQDSVVISQQHLAQALGKATEPRSPDGSLPIPDARIADQIEALSREQKEKLAGRLDLQATDLRSQAAARAEAAAGNYWIPTLSVVGNYSFYNNQNFDVGNANSFRAAYQYGLELKWNIFDGLFSYARAKEASADTIRAEKTEALSRIQAVTDVETNRTDYRFQVSQFVSNTENLDRSKRSVQLALSGLRHGTQTNTDVLDAELDLFNSRAGVIQSQMKALEAQIKFENAIGRKI